MSSKVLREAEIEIEGQISDGIVEAEEKWPETVKLATEKMTEVITEILEGCSNTYGKDVLAGAFKAAFNHTHRQHQSDFWTIMLYVIKEHGEDKDGRNFDTMQGRNLWVQEMCQRVTLAAEDPRTLQLLQDDKNTRYGKTA